MIHTPIPRLIVQLSIPTTLSMLVTNIYNIVDTWFVGRIGTSASGATGVVFGLMSIIQAVGFMFGHGAGSNVSRRLGSRHVEQACKFSATAFYLALAVGAAMGALGLVLLTPLCNLLGSTPTILPYARSYARFILLAAPAMTVSCVINNILRYEGYASFAMVGLVSGGVINIFGDALFIYGFDMGIAGAGLSTMLSQYISVGILFFMHLRGDTQTSFAPRHFTTDGPLVLSIFANGLPSLLRQGLGSISTMALNWQAKLFGDAAVAAMSIVARVTNLLFCVGLGLGQGFQPVSGFNYGAKRYSRVRAAFYFTLGLGTGLMVLFGTGAYLFASPIVTAMRDDPEVVAIGVPALRAQCLALAFIPTSVSVNMLFQSTGLAARASLIATLRSGLCFIPLLLVFTHFWQLWGLQIAQPVADVLSALLCIPFVVQFFRSMPPDQVD